MATAETTTTTRLTKAQVIETIVNELWDARTALSAQNRTRRSTDQRLTEPIPHPRRYTRRA